MKDGMLSGKWANSEQTASKGTKHENTSLARGRDCESRIIGYNDYIKIPVHTCSERTGS